jgi:HD-like signal output (HDOD) protein
VRGELALLGEILHLAGDPEVSLDDFVSSVGQSPSLAARVIRVANSALYGMEGRVQRLDRGVLILGVEAVAGIAASVVVAARARKAQVRALPPDAFWLHSLESGICSELLARFLGLGTYREAYLAGLLHDLGVVDLLLAHGRPYEDLLIQAHRTGCALERLEEETIGETHGERLGIEAEEWGLPESLRLAVAHHEHPDQAPGSSQTLARVVLAAHAVTRGEVSPWTDHPPEGEPLNALEALGLTEADTEEIQALVEERMKAAVPLFS